MLTINNSFKYHRNFAISRLCLIIYLQYQYMYTISICIFQFKKKKLKNKRQKKIYKMKYEKKNITQSNAGRFYLQIQFFMMFSPNMFSSSRWIVACNRNRNQNQKLRFDLSFSFIHTNTHSHTPFWLIMNKKMMAFHSASSKSRATSKSLFRCIVVNKYINK